MIRCVAIVLVCLCCDVCWAQAGYRVGTEGAEAGRFPLLHPGRFRAIVVGDSQTTTPTATRLNVQAQRLALPHCGALLTVGNQAVGLRVSLSNGGFSNLAFAYVDPYAGWDDGGPRDFFHTKGARWICLGDIDSHGEILGRYGLSFGPDNTQAPWTEAWGVGRELVARIAVRTSPRSVPAVAVRSFRGQTSDEVGSRVYELEDSYGITIIEHPIPVSTDPDATFMGVELFLPEGSTEARLDRLDVLGAAIMLAPASDGTPADGVLFAAQGRAAWNVSDHLALISQGSREALIKLVDAEHLVVMLGHNQEDGGIGQFPGAFDQLVALWEQAFIAEGRWRRSTTLVSPWLLSGAQQNEYLRSVDTYTRIVASTRARTRVFSYPELFGLEVPDVADPDRYRLDHSGHPLDLESGRALAEDLMCGLFPGAFGDCWSSRRLRSSRPDATVRTRDGKLPSRQRP